MQQFIVKRDGWKNAIKNIPASLFFNVARISISKILTAGSAFILSVIIARNLGKSDFGFFSLSLSILIVTSELIGSEAADNGLVRFATPYLKNQIEKAGHIFRLIFNIKIITVSTVVIVSIIILKPVLIQLTYKKELSDAIFYGVISGAIASLWRYNLAVLQCFELFTSYAIFHAIPNIIKLLIVSILIIIDSLYLHAALLINVLSLAIGFFLGYLVIPKIKIKDTISKSLTKDIYNFTKWIYLTNIIFVVYSKVDLFMLAYYVDFKDVGIYSVSITIISILDILYASLFTALFPIASRINHHNQYLPYLRKSFTLSILACLIVSPLLFLIDPILIMTYSVEYNESIILIKVLLIGFMFSLLLNPLIIVLYARNNTRIITIIFLFLLIANVTTSIIWIPHYGVMAAAVIVSSLRIIGAVLIAFFAWREIFPSEIQSSK